MLATTERQVVGFRLGALDVVPREQEDTLVGHLGPDLLGPDWSLEEALRRLGTRPDMPVGEALLDQRNLAGIGNMYKAEVCFLRGVHPATPLGQVDDLGQLVRRAQQLLELNKWRAEQSTTGDLRRGHERWVYGRKGKPCRRCGTPIRRETFAALMDAERRATAHGGVEDQARESYWCPSCQPGPDKR